MAMSPARWLPRMIDQLRTTAHSKKETTLTFICKYRQSSDLRNFYVVSFAEEKIIKDQLSAEMFWMKKHYDLVCMYVSVYNYSSEMTA